SKAFRPRRLDRNGRRKSHGALPPTKPIPRSRFPGKTSNEKSSNSCRTNVKDVRYLPEARIESISASNWYDEQRAGLGGEFLSALDAAQDAVVEFPESGSPGEFNTRS